MEVQGKMMGVSQRLMAFMAVTVLTRGGEGEGIKKLVVVEEE